MKQNKQGNILCLCGGVGGAKLAYGFSKILPAENLNIIVNTGDDFEHINLPISPDIDTVTYTLAEKNNSQQGWGLADETWQFMDKLKKENPSESWFQIGDKDLKHHQARQQLLKQGKSLSQVTQLLCNKMQIASNIIPMSDQPVRTMIKTDDGDLSFQHYFVREQCQPKISGFYFQGIETAQASPNFINALHDKNLSAVVICPSNPFVSIDPILALNGIKEQLHHINVPVIAISPIINGQAIKGPTSKMMDELNIPKTSAAIAEHYHSIIDCLVIDNSDQAEQKRIVKIGVKTAVTQTLMKNKTDKIALAKFILKQINTL